jgi:hypothetical protein
LGLHPLISQFAADRSEEKRFALLPLVDLMNTTTTNTALSASVRQARSFYNTLKLPPEQAETVEQIRGLVEEADRKLLRALDLDAQGDWQEALRNRHDAQAVMAELTRPVTILLEDSWRKSDGSGPATVWRDKGESFRISFRKSDGSGPNAAWQDEGKFFLITHIIAFLQHIFAHMQNLVLLVTAGLLLLLVAATSYPFQPRESLLLFSWVAILTSVVVTLFIFVQVNRDKTLGLLTGKTPGRLSINRDFVSRVLFHVVVPVIALLSAQFPQALRQIFSWLSVFEGKGG